tara:strand:+ start:995 stop:2152 length:1158 start_codon:yes stop_codon:yes gene_type:complete
MGFMPFVALGGAAARQSEIWAEEEKREIDLIDDQLKTWTQLGLPVALERRRDKKTNNELVSKLKKQGFSKDQIAVMFGQGKQQEVYELVDKFKNKKMGYSVNDIVTVTSESRPDLTYDQIIEGYMGKVNNGVSPSDAIADISGKSGNINSGYLARIREKRLAAAAAASGVDPAVLMSLASQDIGPRTSLMEGEVTLYDPSSDKTTGTTSRLRLFGSIAADELGGKEIYNTETQSVQTVYDVADNKKEANRLSIIANKKYNELIKGSDGVPGLPESEALAVTRQFIIDQSRAFLGGPKEENDTSASSYSGLTADEIPSRVANDAENAATIETKQNIYLNGLDALVKAGKTREQAEKILQPILDSMNKSKNNAPAGMQGGSVADMYG